jgi:single-strand DNA-binding protein
MADLNKVFLMGALTADPELRYTSGGTAVADLRLVTSRTWSGKEGERREDKLYIDITVWNRQAENCCQYLKKGRTIFVEGYLKLESWESPTGEKRSKVKVEAERVQFLDRKDDGGGGGGYSADDDYSPAPAREQGPPRRATGGPSGGSRGYSPPRNASPAPPPRPPAPDTGDAEDDDIPF